MQKKVFTGIFLRWQLAINFFFFQQIIICWKKVCTFSFWLDMVVVDNWRTTKKSSDYKKHHKLHHANGELGGYYTCNTTVERQNPGAPNPENPEIWMQTILVFKQFWASEIWPLKFERKVYARSKLPRNGVQMKWSL